MKKEVSLFATTTNISDWQWQHKAEETLSAKLSAGFEIESVVHLENGRVLYTLVKTVNPEED